MRGGGGIFRWARNLKVLDCIDYYRLSILFDRKQLKIFLTRIKPILKHLQQITHLSPQYQKNDVLVMKVLQQITNPILITYKFLVITKTHLSLT